MFDKRQTQIQRLRDDISERSLVIQRLPEGHPVRDRYLNDVVAKADEAHRLENRQTFDVWLVAMLAVVVAAVVSGTGLATGILLGGALVCAAVALVTTHTLDR